MAPNNELTELKNELNEIERKLIIQRAMIDLLFAGRYMIDKRLKKHEKCLNQAGESLMSLFSVLKEMQKTNNDETTNENQDGS